MEPFIIIAIIAVVAVGGLYLFSSTLNHLLFGQFRPTAKVDVDDGDFAFHIECEDPKDCEELLQKVNSGKIKIRPQQ